ncbi:MAG TPA: RluA family pseudouridine synthase [Vicinamibacterales bacterium]|nr:RluA family pseudouridine synthase [Vicinamibacterales bacterium]
MTPAATRQAHVVLDDRDAGLRLDQVLTKHVPALSRAQAQRLIQTGRVTLSDGRPKPALIVWAGLEVDVDIPTPTRATPAPEALPLPLLYQDADMAVVDKPAGMVVHPAAGHATGTLVNALLHHLDGLSGVGGATRPGIVHRLDRGTSGVMVVAKTDAAHRALSKQFHDRQVTKEYVALVWGTMRAGETLSRPIGRDPRDRKKMSTRARKVRSAVTRVLSAEPLGGVSFVRLAIGTGRTHQIRVHLSDAGHPVVGDLLYGGERKSVPPRLAALAKLRRPFLHAAKLTIAHPADGRSLTFQSALPGDLDGVLEALRRAAGVTARHNPDVSA